MRLEWFQCKILVKILNILHINFQRKILKGQLSINWGKTRSLAHNNFPVVLFFILISILVLFLGFFLCAYLYLSTFICLSNISWTSFYLSQSNSICVVLFSSIKLFLAFILWPLNLVLEFILFWCLIERKFDLGKV